MYCIIYVCPIFSQDFYYFLVCFQDSFKGQNLPSNMEKGQSTDLFTVQQDGSCPDEVFLKQVI